MDILKEYYMNTNNDPSEEIVEMLMELFVRDVVFPSHWRLLNHTSDKRLDTNDMMI